ncbi:MAG: oligosaccharide flippase family protein [Lachnospiraceae bacterium]|nr:oligosaccharide flippase family protein [Lachnospiraceae bacterium]
MSENSKSNNFIVQGTILGVASVIVRLLGLLYQMPVAHIIGDMGNGYYGYAYNIYAVILLISSFSIPTAVSKLISASITAKKFKEAQKIFKASLIIVGSFSGLLAILTFIFAPQLLTMFSDNQAGAVLALRVLSPVIFLSGILGVLRGYFQGYNTMIPTSFSQVIEGILNAIVSIVAAAIIVIPYKTDVEKTAIYGAAGSTIGTGVGVLFGLLFMVFLYSGFRQIANKRARRDRHKVIMDYGEITKLILLTVAPVLFSSLIFNICPVIDQNLFAGILEKQGTNSNDITILQGIYSVKYLKLVSLPVSIAAALSAAIIPAIVNSVTRNDLYSANKQIDTAMKFTMLIALPCTVGLAVLAEPIMLLFGRVYTLPIAVHVLVFGSINVIFNCVSTLTNAVLQGLDKMKYPVIHGVIAIIVHIIVTVICLNNGMGIYALLVGGIAFSLVMWVCNAIVIYQTTGYKKILGNNFFGILLSSLGMGICVFIVYFILDTVLGDGLEFIGLIVSMLVAFFSYLVLLYLFNAFTPDDYEALPFGDKIRSLGIAMHLVETEEHPFDEEVGVAISSEEEEIINREKREKRENRVKRVKEKFAFFEKRESVQSSEYEEEEARPKKKAKRSRASEEMIVDDFEDDEEENVMNFLKEDEGFSENHTVYDDADDLVSDLMSNVEKEYGKTDTNLDIDYSESEVDLSDYELSEEAKNRVDSMFTKSSPSEDESVETEEEMLTDETEALDELDESSAYESIVDSALDASVKADFSAMPDPDFKVEFSSIPELNAEINNAAKIDDESEYADSDDITHNESAFDANAKNEAPASDIKSTEQELKEAMIKESKEAPSIKDGLGPNTEPINVEKILRKYQEQEKRASRALNEQQKLNDKDRK